MAQLIESIRRICKGIAESADVPEHRLPIVTVTPESIPVMVNDSTLTRRLTSAFNEWFGTERVKLTPPITGGEDFSEFGRTADKVPICLWWVGATDLKKFEESERTGVPVPSNHSPTFAPVPEPTLKTSVTSMTAAVLEIMGAARNGNHAPR
jgi:hippurate hydrolase